MTRVHETYLEKAKAILDRLAAEEAESIQKAGVAVADRVAEDRLIYVIGPGGHSQIGAEEVFSRAGGLAAIYSFLDDGFYLGNGAGRSMRIERTPGYARALLSAVDFDNLGPGVANLLSIYQAFSDWSDEQMRNHFSGIRYGDLKKQVADMVVEKVEPFQKRYQEITSDPGYLAGILREGAERVTPVANSTVELVKQRMGLYT